MFGDNPPQSLDELMEQMQQQMSQMQSLMDSLSDGARQELEDALQSAMDPRLSDEMSEFASLMQSLLPPGDLSREYPFLGDDSMTLEQAMDAMRQMQSLDQAGTVIAAGDAHRQPGRMSTRTNWRSSWEKRRAGRGRSWIDCANCSRTPGMSLATTN